MATDQRTLVPDAASGALNFGETVLPASTTVGGYRIRGCLVVFEVEQMILGRLKGPHVPIFLY